VDNDYFRRRIVAVRRENARTRLLDDLQLHPSHPTVLFVSKLQVRKRCSDLVAAFAALRPGTAAQLLIVGDGEERGRLEALVRAQGLPNVRFAGFRNQSELPAFYDLCDLFVLPSEREPWGLVVNEAMNAGRPVVASDAVGAARDLVRHGQSGFVYPVGDVARLRDCLQILLDHRELRLKMGSCARELVDGWGVEATLGGVRAAISALSIAA
jgi:glycosyltransferase involved in cell wall biosynthesis